MAGEEIVGFIHALLREAAPLPILVPRRFVVIDSLAVREEARRQGIGQALMAVIHPWAAEKGAASVELNVYEFNQGAIAFYEAQGYAVLRRWMSKPVERAPRG